MKTIEISGTGRVIGKVQNKMTRSEGNVPCVMYGAGEPVLFKAASKELRKALYTPETFIVNLTIDGQKTQAIVKEAQFHPVNESIVHVDFLRLGDSPISVNLPVRLTGNAPGVLSGGKLVQKLRKLKVKGFPGELPEAITVDVSDLELGFTIKVGDLSLPGLTILSIPARAIVSVEISRASKLGEGEGVEGEEGEEGAEEGAEAAPAAEGGE